MSLATRCSACGTAFRVQKDQLKASEGWVRCGRCGTVFSALEGLFDLEREAHSGPMPLQPTPPAGPPPSPPPAVSPSPPPAADDAPRRAATSGAMPLDEMPLHDAEAERAAERAASLAPFRALQPSRHGDDDDADEAALSILEHSGSHTLDESRPQGDSSTFGPLSRSSSLPPSSKLPSFAREADGALRWKRQRPVVRRLTIAAAIVLPLLLAAQIALVNRDLVAARWPASADVLRAVCAPLGCTVEAPRLIDAMTVESSGLSRIDGTALYSLQVAVRNRAGWPVAMPAFDVTLTDARGEVVSRRVLRAADFGDGAPTELGPNAEWSAQATLDVGERRVTGYTIDLFYP